MRTVYTLDTADGVRACILSAWPMLPQSTSGRPAEPAIGHAAHGQSVMGVPSDISHVLHPDGRSTPAMFVEVTADCKVCIILGTIPYRQASCSAPN